MEIKDLPLFLTPKQFAKVMGISEWQAQKLCREGQIPCKKLSTQWRIPRSALEC